MADDPIRASANDALPALDAQRARVVHAKYAIGPDAQRDATDHHERYAQPGDPIRQSDAPDAARVEERRKADRGDAQAITDDNCDAAPGVVLATRDVARLVSLSRRALGQQKYGEQEQREEFLWRA